MSNSYSNTKMFCEICETLSITSQDMHAKSICGACRQCELKFFQPNREKWNNGWRPDKDAIDSFKKENQKSVYSILSEINNYI
tara:strand:+ start:60 stop:308 length:249 start_codon:yes stop_codon:yes gene_type:complete